MHISRIYDTVGDDNVPNVTRASGAEEAGNTPGKLSLLEKKVQLDATLQN